MRCFIAIDISEEIKAGLAELQQELAESVDIRKGDVKWVRPEAMHLTLKFLGEIRDVEAVDVCNIVKEVAARHRAFSLGVRQVGHFGGRSARVLWVGAGLSDETLSALHADLEERLAEAGWPEETRKFSAHLTLCRIRNAKAGVKLAEAAKRFEDFELGTLRADSVSVYESKLTPHGPIYTCLGKYGLLP
jgi:2'-5' RNA ligase